jgi:hypothetical protein
VNVLSLLLLLSATPARASTDAAVNGCLNAWKHAPFAKGAEPAEVISPSVKVLGIGKKDFVDDKVTKKPRLVLIKPSVNVLGGTKFSLLNPNGWYCFKTNVSVLGKTSIKAHCNAHIATSGDGGANVLGADESDHGVTVLGTLRIERVGCTPEQVKKQAEEAVKKIGDDRNTEDD